MRTKRIVVKTPLAFGRWSCCNALGASFSAVSSVWTVGGWSRPLACTWLLCVCSVSHTRPRMTFADCPLSYQSVSLNYTSAVCVGTCGLLHASCNSSVRRAAFERTSWGLARAIAGPPDAVLGLSIIWTEIVFEFGRDCTHHVEFDHFCLQAKG